jgi:hypothetical protein
MLSTVAPTQGAWIEIYNRQLFALFHQFTPRNGAINYHIKNKTPCKGFMSPNYKNRTQYKNTTPGFFIRKFNGLQDEVPALMLFAKSPKHLLRFFQPQSSAKTVK